MKRKAINWNTVPWTKFEPGVSTEDVPAFARSHEIWINSRYQVHVTHLGEGPFGPGVHLSIKTHDKAARHDWRDLQRIKNELVGPECEAVELYPAESRLVDTSNQWHLYCFPEFVFPFGYQDRLVSEARWGKARQRPWPKEDKPPDLASAEVLQAQYEKLAKTK